MTSKNNESLANLMRQLMRIRVSEVTRSGYKVKNLNETLTNENIKAASFAADLYADSQIIDEYNDTDLREKKIHALIESYKTLDKSALKIALAELQLYNDVILELLKKTELRIEYFKDENRSRARHKKEMSKNKNVREDKFVFHDKVTAIIDEYLEELKKGPGIHQDGFKAFKIAINARCSQKNIKILPSYSKLYAVWKNKTGFTSTKKVTEHKL